MSRYTIILLTPDWLTNDYGHDTFISHVEADSLAEAVATAQAKAMRAYSAQDDGRPDDDFLPIAAFAGFHDPLVRER